MSTSLETARQELSKEMGDYWDSTTTSAGAAGGTTVVDTALKAKENDWVGSTDMEAYDIVTSGTYDGEERKISSLDNSTGTLTVLAHGGQIASSVTYEVHRRFTPSEKRRSLIHAAKASFPKLFKEIRDESLTAGNWLRDGDLEHSWTSSTANTYWQASTVTMTQTTTATKYVRSATSAKLDTAAGYIYQSDTQNTDLLELAAHRVKFKAKVWCDTASCARLAIYDGTTTTYSDYHPGTSNWANEDADYDFLEVEATIDDDPTSIEFRVYHDVAAGTTYVDDLRVIGPERDRVYIGDLGLAQNRLHQVLEQRDEYIQDEPWIRLHNWWVDSDGYLLLQDATSDYRLRILGIGYLDFLVSGASSTAWTATINIDSPQTKILYAEAACYLCRQMIMPVLGIEETNAWRDALNYWMGEAKDRKAKFGMRPPEATIKWR